MRSRIRARAAAALLAAGVATTALAQPDPAKVIRAVFPTAETGFDPQAAGDIYSNAVNRVIFDTLYKYDHLARPYKLVPNTAVALPEIGDGGKLWTIRVRPGIFFADGPAFKGQKRELTAHDYVYAWKRVMDMNDRALRDITVSLGGPANGFPRQDGFDIVVASEVMAIFCLATDLDDLSRRLGNIIVARTRDKKPIRAKDLCADGAMTVLLKDALMPNLVQTLEGNPAFVHGGPFANIAHGCNSIAATRLALRRERRAVLFGDVRTKVLLLENEAGILEIPIADVGEVIRNAEPHSLHALALCATSYATAHSVSFFEGHEAIPDWNRAQRYGKRTPLELDHLMASLGIPFLFPPVQVDDEFYGDGAMRQTAPLSPCSTTAWLRSVSFAP